MNLGQALGACCAATLAALTTALVACGGGTAAIAGGGGGGGSAKKNSAPSVPVLEVPAGLSELSPATIRFTLADPEGNPISVKLEYESPAGSGLKHMTLVNKGDLVDLLTSASGVTHEAVWNFAADLETTSLTKDVRVVLTATGGQGKVVPGTVLGDVVAAFGNNPALIVATVPSVGPGGEVVGIAKITFTVADDSGHDVSILPEYRLAGSIEWLPTTPAGQLPVSFEAPPGGVTIDFFWDVLVDLGTTEHDVEFRFTADDGFTLPTGPLVPGTPAAFRVDNNAAPFGDLNAEGLILNPDERRGLPVPFTVSDPEGDPVRTVFQWRQEGEDFPDLGLNVAEIEEILANPEQRAAYHIASPFPTYLGGRVVPRGPASVELPELASNAAGLLHVADVAVVRGDLSQALTGRQLELMRSSNIPAPVAHTWASNPLVGPVAALTMGDGLTALVLDEPAFAQWRLREIELATGVVVREIASSGTGTPTAMTWEPGERSVLLADHLSAFLWQVLRVDLATGAVTPLVGVHDGAVETGIVRGVVALGTGAALATLGGSVLRLDYADVTQPRATTVVTGLHTPWGLALDPLRTNHVFVAERDAFASDGVGRVISLAFDTYVITPVMAQMGDATGFPRPQALTLEHGGSRLLVVTDADPFDGARELRAVDLSSTGKSQVFEITRTLKDDVPSIAVGCDGLRLLALSEENDLAVGGGIQQRRVISGYEPATRIVEVTQTFEPVLEPNQPWRMPRTSDGLLDLAKGSPTGVFLWNSRDVPRGGEVWLRLSVLDSDVGATEEMQAPKRVRTALEGHVPLSVGSWDLGNGSSPLFVAAADVDSDGGLDLVASNHSLVSGEDVLSVFWRTDAGLFDPTPLVLGGLGMTDLPEAVAVSDVDADGDMDLVSANVNSKVLAIFWQTSAGSFDPMPLLLGRSGVMEFPTSLAAGDLDGDGDVDLVLSNWLSDRLSVFWQTGLGTFAPAPYWLGDATTTNGAYSVAAADLDGDGDLDLVSANRNVGTLTVYWQESPGTFDPLPLTLDGAGMTHEPVSVAVADMDGDGDFDLVSANFSSDTVTVFWQRAARAFDPSPLSLGSAATTDGPSLVAPADLDGDGDLDIAFHTFSPGGTLAAFWQIEPGVFDSSPSSLGSGGRFVPVDIDGDGDIDVVSTAADSLEVHWQKGADALGLEPLVLGGPGTTPGSRSVVAGDVDGDGDTDLVASAGGGPAVFWQTEPGKVDAAPSFVGNSATGRSITASDVDGDGNLDLSLANFSASALTVLWQKGGGVFESVPLSLQGSLLNPSSLATADMDGDGDLDLVSNSNDHSLRVYWQISPRIFDPVPLALGNFLTTYGLAAVGPADVDGDGDVDLVSANRLSDELTIFFQVAPGSFDPPVPAGSVQEGAAPVAVATTDVDGDGAVDLVSANENGDTLAVFWQARLGVFDSDPLVLGGAGTTGTPVSVATADMDGDGDVDIVSANQESDTLTVFWQTAPRKFDLSPQLLGNVATTNGPGSVIAADIDGDGDLDLVSANPLSSTLTVFFNAH